ncbi:two-component system sensor histidine kinase NtrB, partial [Candidatus Deferrimicrobium sp.]|uniref:two-component system sensor histidine kinase NtrB n=1 Tax=Candidatus Deferrimicrobium sp. TaxID=3060586 RepID=UPI003C66B1E6
PKLMDEGILSVKIEQQILSSFRAGVLAIDLQGKIIFVNEIAKKILTNFPVGIDENLRGRAGENALFRFLLESIDLQYLPTRLEISLPSVEDTPRSIGFTLAELREGEHRTGICAFFKDLTNVEMQEENRDLDERLRLLGQMAAGLAHEIRNPIASVGVHCGLLRSRYQGDQRILSSLQHIEKEIAQVEFIIRECLNFVRPAELGIRPVRIDSFLKRIAEQAGKLFEGTGIAYKGSLVGDVSAEMDESQMEQAIMNVIANAAHASGTKGSVTLRARITRGYWDTAYGGREPLLPQGSSNREDFLTISIRDDGPGIPEEIRDRIFVPFFTTKKEGTGIGLPLVQKIVYAHRGVLDIVSETGKGTEFIIKLPVKQDHGESHPGR